MSMAVTLTGWLVDWLAMFAACWPLGRMSDIFYELQMFLYNKYYGIIYIHTLHLQYTYMHTLLYIFCLSNINSILLSYQWRLTRPKYEQRTTSPERVSQSLKYFYCHFSCGWKCANDKTSGFKVLLITPALLTPQLYLCIIPLLFFAFAPIVT